MTETPEMRSKRLERFAKELDRLQGLIELGVEDAKRDYELVFQAYLATKKEVEERLSGASVEDTKR